MSDEIDPSWPPPHARSEHVSVDRPQLSPMPSDDVDPAWLPPAVVPSVPLASEKQGRARSSWRLAALALTTGIGIGAVIAWTVDTSSRSDHLAPPATPTPGPPGQSAPMPSSIPVTPPNAASPPSSVGPTPATELPANPLGYVQVATQSGQTWCDIMQAWVGCETAATNWPTVDGERAHDVKVGANGDFHWVIGNLGRMAYKVTLGYQTYHAMGWTISATKDGTTFTNDRTGHGMHVSVESASPF